MKTLAKYIDDYSKKYSCYLNLKAIQDRKIERNEQIIKTAERSIERAKKSKNNIYHPRWIKILENIAKEMLQYFPEGYTSEILGPFGIGSKTSIWIKNPDWNINNDIKYKAPQLYSFEVSPDLTNNTFYKVDNDINTGEYAKGTIGEVNGLNHPEIAIVNTTTIKELIEMYYPNYFKK